MSQGGSSIDQMSQELEPAEWFRKKKREISISKKSTDQHMQAGGGDRSNFGNRITSGMGEIAKSGVPTKGQYLQYSTNIINEQAKRSQLTVQGQSNTNSVRSFKKIKISLNRFNP